MPSPSNVQNIPAISVSNNSQRFPNGTFNNAYIKALNVKMGLTQGATTLSMGLVNESGIYNDLSGALSYNDPYYINVGNLKFVMYLKGQSRDINKDSKFQQLDFTDGSHILDRVYVGLLGVHASLDRKNLYTTSIKSAQIPVSCDPCPSANVISNLISQPNRILTVNNNSFPNASFFTDRELREASLTPIGNNVNGGFIILGDEKFTKTSCDLATVDYSFTQLKQACANMGIYINITDPTIKNGIPLLRRNYSGTLRSVLKRWCSDFGKDFYFDFTSPTPNVNEVDLTIGVLANEINTIANLAKTIKSSSGALIQSIQESESLDGTFRNFPVARFRKKKGIANFDRKTYYHTALAPIQTQHVLGTDALDGRSYAEFDQSCALAKYNESARSLFLTYLAQQKNDSKIFRAMGFNNHFEITDKDFKSEIIDECFDPETYADIIKQYDPTLQIGKNRGGEFCSMYVGSFSQETASKYLEWEKKIANEFMGQYFYTNLLSQSDKKFGGYKFCPTGGNARYEIESEVLPNPEIHFALRNTLTNPNSSQQRLLNQQSLPFADILYGLMPANLWTYFNWASSPFIRIHKRSSAPWPVLPEFVDKIFKDKTDKGVKDLVKPYLGRFQEIQGLAETKIRARFKGLGNLFDVVEKLKETKKDVVPAILITPLPSRISQIISVSPMNHAVINPKEKTYFQKSLQQPQSGLNCNGSMKCEIQENLQKFVCDPKLDPNCAFSVTPPQSVTGSTGLGKFFNARINDPFPDGLVSNLSQGFNLRFKFAPTTCPRFVITNSVDDEFFDVGTYLNIKGSKLPEPACFQAGHKVSIKYFDGTVTRTALFNINSKAPNSHDLVLSLVGGGVLPRTLAGDFLDITPATRQQITNANIIFPCGTSPVHATSNNLYLANYVEHLKVSATTNKVEKVLEDLDTIVNDPDMKRVSAIDVNTILDVESQQPDKFQVNNPNAIQTETYIQGFGYLSLVDYYNFMNQISVYKNANPKKDLSVSFGSADFGILEPYMKPEYGLNSMGLNIDSNGISSNASWSSALPQPPPPDLFTSEIQPSIASRGMDT